MIQHSAVELCKKALAIDSSMATGTLDFTNFLSELASTLDLKVNIKNYLFRDLDFQNILMSNTDDLSNLDYLFVNPIDTEAPGPFRAWTMTDQDPFDVTIKDGKMYGLGANSGKLISVLLLKTLSDLSFKNKKIALLGTYGREVRSHGALRFLKENGIEPVKTLIGFPTENKIVHAQPGRIRMRINFPFTESEKKMRQEHDESEHSSSESQYFHSSLNSTEVSLKNKKEIPRENLKTNISQNAILQALEFINNLPDQLLVLDFAGGKDLYSDPRSCLFEFDLSSGQDILMGHRLKNFFGLMNFLSEEFKTFQNPDFKPLCASLHLGRVVCDYEGIEFWGECVFPPGIPEAVSDRWIDKLREEIKNIGGSSKLLSQRWPYVYQGEKSFIKNLLDLNSQETPASIAYTSESDLFKLSGFESLIYGPGEFSQMFKPNENISLKSLEESLFFYKSLLSKLT